MDSMIEKGGSKEGSGGVRLLSQHCRYTKWDWNGNSKLMWTQFNLSKGFSIECQPATDQSGWEIFWSLWSMVKLKCVRYCHTTKQVKIPKICPVMTELSLLCVYFRFRGVWSHIPHYTRPHWTRDQVYAVPSDEHCSEGYLTCPVPSSLSISTLGLVWLVLSLC